MKKLINKISTYYIIFGFLILILSLFIGTSSSEYLDFIYMFIVLSAFALFWIKVIIFLFKMNFSELYYSWKGR